MKSMTKWRSNYLQRSIKQKICHTAAMDLKNHPGSVADVGRLLIAALPFCSVEQQCRQYCGYFENTTRNATSLALHCAVVVLPPFFKAHIQSLSLSVVSLHLNSCWPWHGRYQVEGGSLIILIKSHLPTIPQRIACPSRRRHLLDQWNCANSHLAN